MADEPVSTSPSPAGDAAPAETGAQPAPPVKPATRGRGRAAANIQPATPPQQPPTQPAASADPNAQQPADTVQDPEATPSTVAPSAEPPPAVPGQNAQAEPPLWMGFNEPAKTPESIAMSGEENKADLVPLAEQEAPDGFAWYVCRRDCGSGKYRRGHRYLLRNGQPAELFRKL